MKKHLLLTIKHIGSFCLTQNMRLFCYVVSCAASEEARKLSLTQRKAILCEREKQGILPDCNALVACSMNSRYLKINRLLLCGELYINLLAHLFQLFGFLPGSLWQRC